MKLLVFAHIPPPHHGQSYMVKLMLDGLGGDLRKAPGAGRKAQGDIECYHVNARFSDDMEDIGAIRWGKALLVFRYCVEAIWCRFRYGLEAIYYVPAPGKRAALYRDWMVMLLCRPFFRHSIHHWHAAGLGDWLETDATWIERRITHWLLGRASLGLAVAIASMRDALWFRSRQVAVVPYGIPDPCPEFVQRVHPRRAARLAARRQLLEGKLLGDGERGAAGGDPQVLRVLYLSHCLREKGVFDTLEAVALTRRQLTAARSPFQIHLHVAGEFLEAAEAAEFHARIAREDLRDLVSYVGFVSGAQKQALLQESDCLCFPTYYHAESFGLVLVEAMAAGMNVVATRWRAISEILPVDTKGLVPVRSPEKIAASLGQSFLYDVEKMRARYLDHYTVERYVAALRHALSTLD